MVELTDSVRYKADKVYVDMYVGNGKESPSITTRLSMAEDQIERISKNLNKALWLVGGTLLGLIAEIIKGAITK